MMTLGKFRGMTAKLPDNTPMLSEDRCYQNSRPIVTTVIIVPANHSTGHYNRCGFEPDFGDDPERYGLSTEEHVQRNRITAVVFE